MYVQNFNDLSVMLFIHVVCLTPVFSSLTLYKTSVYTIYHYYKFGDSYKIDKNMFKQLKYVLSLLKSRSCYRYFRSSKIYTFACKILDIFNLFA